MDRRSNSQTIGLIALMAIVTAVVAVFSLRSGQPAPLPPLKITEQPAADTAPPLVPPQTEEPRSTSPAQAPAGSPAASAPSEIVVHVAGAVVNPGVYRLPSGSRAIDAVRAAGGATNYADTNSVNLAAPVQDGSRIYIPQNGEQAVSSVEVGVKGGRRRSSAAPDNTPSQSEPVPQPETPQQAQAPANDKLTDPAQGVVNINTASVDELQRLPGIGPALAQRIIDYRQTNGGFKNAEELKDVSGIGEKKYAKLAPYIRVN